LKPGESGFRRSRAGAHSQIAAFPDEQRFRRFLRPALAEARRAARSGDVPVGAVVVRGNRVIARGRNRRELDADPVAHAEIVALAAAARRLESWRLGGCTVVVTLEPCPMCLAACQLARVDRVVYGAADPKGGAISLGYALHADPRLNHRFEVDEARDLGCAEILRAFFKKRRSLAGSGTGSGSLPSRRARGS